MYTTVTFKTSKRLHSDAKKTARKLGIPFTTVLNAILQQFVREQSITLSANKKLLASHRLLDIDTHRNLYGK